VRVAAGGFALYALAQIFVRPIPAFPAQYVNQAVFLAAFGFPIQIIRAMAAIIITGGLLRATQRLEQERQAKLEAAHEARLRAVEQHDALRRELLQHIVQSQEEERARIARELHDEVAQFLSAFSLELGALKSVLKRGDTNRMVDHLQELNRQMSQSLYSLVRDLRPAQLDDLGLVPALKSLIAQEFQAKGMEVELHVTGMPGRLNSLVETVLYRVSQEALTNVRRHSGAAHAQLELEYGGGQVAVRIRDEGRGFDPEEDFRPPRGWGLAGMRERVEALQGTLCIQSRPGHGTAIEVVIPLKPQAEKELAYGQDQTSSGG
jgi:signal transduction histidine kinase